jgi:hypothetical protein
MKNGLRTAIITRGGDGSLLVRVSDACRNIEAFDELTAQERREFAIRAIERGAVTTMRLRTTDRARIGDAAQLAADAETCNPTLTGGRAPGAGYERERRREAERCAKLQRSYDDAGKGGRDARG